MLTATQVRAAKRPGKYRDERGLYLMVRPDGRRFWAFRWSRNGKAHEMSLGNARDVSLADARRKAADARKLLVDGGNPIERRRAQEAEKEAKSGTTFGHVADLYIAAHEKAWRNATHRQQWRNTLRDYVLPIVGKRPIDAIETSDVMKIIEPLWAGKTETASRVRGRIENIIDYAKARGWHSGENPARWRGHLANLLPARSKVQRVVHHAALPWREIGAFVAELRTHESMSAKAVEFAILTAARSGEVRGARWNEIGLATKTWTVPAERMKADREHRVPLSDRAADILRIVEPLRKRPDGLVFPGGRIGHSLTDVALSKSVAAVREGITLHGFRSTFRDWCAEATSYPREVAEAALAHTNRDRTEAAYFRGDVFAKRVRLMAEWAAFCSRPAIEAEVRPIRA